MAIPMQADLVPGGDDLRRKVAMTLDLLADEEEGRGCLRPSKQIEDDWCGARIGAVVEGQRNSLLVRQATGDAKQSR